MYEKLVIIITSQPFHYVHEITTKKEWDPRERERDEKLHIGEMNKNCAHFVHRPDLMLDIFELKRANLNELSHSHFYAIVR